MVIVRLTTDDGLAGIGEGHDPFRSGQGSEGMRAVSEIVQRNGCADLVHLRLGGRPRGG